LRIILLIKNVLVLQFDFTIPEFSPASFRSTTGELAWAIRVAFLQTAGEKQSLASVGKKVIRKCTTLYPLPGFMPTVQGERDLMHGMKCRAGVFALFFAAFFFSCFFGACCAGASMAVAV
jgi:hypothetical protein